MRLRVAVLGLALALSRVPSVPAQETISKVKLAPQDYRDRQIHLAGEVIEVRALSPRSERGVYRLVDGSDPAGILVRTDRLPDSGGPFRVRARLSPELLSEGSLLLDEVERDTRRSPMIAVAGLIAILGIGGAMGAVSMYLRARHSERHMHLGPPMWLIPTGAADRPEEPEAQSLHFNYQLQYIQEERSDALDRRKRQLLGALAVAGGIGVASSAWFLMLRREDNARPAFVLIAPEVAEATPTPVDTTLRQDDSLRLGLLPSPLPAEPPPSSAVRNPSTDPAETPAPTRGLSRRDSIRLGLVTPPRQDSARAAPPVVATRDSVVAVAPPPPPAVTRDTTPAPPPPPPPPPPVDMAALRRGATADLNRGIQLFASAVTARDVNAVGSLFAASDSRRRDRFVQFLRESAPTSSFGATDEAEVTETAADAGFTLLFKWRGDFGVERKKTVRFQASTRHQGDNWSFAGVRLLENFP